MGRAGCAGSGGSPGIPTFLARPGGPSDGGFGRRRRNKGASVGGGGRAAMAAGGREHSLREELTCAICCELFSQPVMLDCMHHYCKACIQRYWASGPRVASCPQCRRQFPRPTFRTHHLLAGLVEKVRLYGSQEHRHQVQVSPEGRRGCAAPGAGPCSSQFPAGWFL